MKISQTLPQFDHERALILVLGRKNGVFYFARNGVIRKVDHFDVEQKSYSDREGFFLRSGRGEFFGTGVPLKDLKEYIRAKFLSETNNRLKHLEKVNDANAIYIFSPRGLVSLVLGTIGTKQRNKIIKEVITGNMTKKHPLELIKKLKQSERAGKKIIKSKEAKKILKKSIQARKVIKGKG